MTATHDASLALRATGLLAAFNQAAILSAADVHVAQRLGALGGQTDDAVLLATALVVRSTRHGSVVLDLATAQETTSPDVDVDELAADVPAEEVVLDWPSDDWVDRCAASSLIGGPLRMSGTRLWLGRYWDQEEQVAAELRDRSEQQPADLDPAVLEGALDRLFAPTDDAFAGNEDPIADLREEDFDKLFQRIVSLAPDPIGLGDRWKKVAANGSEGKA